MPVELRAAVGLAFEEEGLLMSSSREERSSPLVFLTAVLEFLGVARASFSSAARMASFSAFLRAASSFLASASSLCCGLGLDRWDGVVGEQQRLLLSVGFCAFAPFLVFGRYFLRALRCSFLVCYFGFL